MESRKICPHCGGELTVHCNPVPTVDVVILVPGCESGEDSVVLVNRANPPLGWALPGGFVDCGETCEGAAVRECLEETGLEVILTGLLGVYSDPARDPRQHTMSVVYTGLARNLATLRAGDDAGDVRLFPLDRLPRTAFDHDRILADFRARLAHPS